MPNLTEEQKQLLLDCITNGYFPRELPPNFKPDNFDEIVANEPSNFNHDKNKYATAISHNITRFGSFTRKLDIPNPITFYRLAKIIIKNHDTLSQASPRSLYTLTFPIRDKKNERCFVAEYDWDKWKEEKIKRQAGYSYVVQTDISNYYPSIYTHIISWVLHTKAVAKSNSRDDALLGNIIDKIIRDCQDRQTQGIQVGPDTSLIISELILNHIDTAISDKLKKHKIKHAGTRFIDDYDLYFLTNDDAKKATNIIFKVLREYELTPNPHKTIIKELPIEYEKSWVSHIRKYPTPKKDPSAKKTLVIDYFSNLMLLQKNNPLDSVIAFALSKMEKTNFIIDDRPLFFSLLLNLVKLDSSVLKLLITFISHDLDSLHDKELKKFLTEKIPTIILSCAHQGKGNDILWGLHICYLFKIKIKTKEAKIIYDLGNALVKLMCLDLSRINLFDNEESLTFNSEDLFSENWILHYTVFKEDIFKSFRRGVNRLNSNQLFSCLIQSNVTFYKPLPPTLNDTDTSEYVNWLCAKVRESDSTYNQGSGQTATCNFCGSQFEIIDDDWTCEHCGRDNNDWAYDEEEEEDYEDPDDSI